VTPKYGVLPITEVSQTTQTEPNLWAAAVLRATEHSITAVAAGRRIAEPGRTHVVYQQGKRLVGACAARYVRSPRRDPHVLDRRGSQAAGQGRSDRARAGARRAASRDPA